MGSDLGHNESFGFRRKINPILVVGMFLIIAALTLVFTKYTKGTPVHFLHNTLYEVPAVRFDVAKPEQWTMETVSWNPRIFIYRNFVSKEDCEHLIKIGKNKLTPSMVVGEKIDLKSEVRTSNGAWLPVDDPVVARLEKRISEITHLPVENGEAFYLLRYEKGEQYKAHHDYFEGPGKDRYIGAAGQRVATFLTYLSPADTGGGTGFPQAGIQVFPNQGDSVLFFDAHPDGTMDPLSLHEGLPVQEGVKWALAKWIRSHTYRRVIPKKDAEATKPENHS